MPKSSRDTLSVTKTGQRMKANPNLVKILTMGTTMAKASCLAEVMVKVRSNEVAERRCCTVVVTNVLLAIWDVALKSDIHFQI